MMNRLKTMALSLAISVAVFSSISQKAFALSPPWYLLQARFKATLEGDPFVKVNNLQPIPGGYELAIEVYGGQKKAKALSTFLSKSHHFGGVVVQVEVFNSRNQLVPPDAIPAEIDGQAKLIRKALNDNQYFVQIDPGNGVYRFFIEFSNRVIQYYGDNLGDAYKNINQVAAEAFAQVLDLPAELHIGTSTSPQCLNGSCDNRKDRK